MEMPSEMMERMMSAAEHISQPVSTVFHFLLRVYLSCASNDDDDNFVIDNRR